MAKRLVGILYNQFFGIEGDYHFESEQAVLEEVHAVKKNLLSLSYACELLPIGKNNFSALMQNLIKKKWYCIINLCESINGKNLDQIQIPALLDLLGIGYTGSGTYSMAVTTDKAATKGILSAFNLPVPKYYIFTPNDLVPPRLRYPLIVKPQFEDASVGIDMTSVVYAHNKLAEKVKELHQLFNQSVIVEQYIDGREINVAIIDNGEPCALPISEIIFKDFPAHYPKIVSYKAKWDKNSWQEKQTIGVCPARLTKRTENYLKDISLKAYQVCKCRDYARIDIRLDKKNHPYIIEVNANPDISPDAGFMRSWKVIRKTFSDFVHLIITEAHKRSRYCS